MADELTPAEKAKMDYQSQLEMKKFVRGSRFWDIVLDKGILALLVALFTIGLLAYVNYRVEMTKMVQAKELEKYKLDEAEKRFFLEARLRAVTTTASAVSEMSGAYFRNSDPHRTVDPKQATEQLDTAIAKAVDVINTHIAILGDAYDEDLSRYLQVHRSLVAVGFEKWGPYREWMAGLSGDYDRFMHSLLIGQSVPDDRRMRLKSITFAQRNRLTPQQYLDEQSAYWKDRSAPK